MCGVELGDASLLVLHLALGRCSTHLRGQRDACLLGERVLEDDIAEALSEGDDDVDMDEGVA